jgi:hypothetical protein
LFFELASPSVAQANTWFFSWWRHWAQCAPCWHVWQLSLTVTRVDFPQVVDPLTCDWSFGLFLVFFFFNEQYHCEYSKNTFPVLMIIFI